MARKFTVVEVIDALDAQLMRIAEQTMTPAEFVDYAANLVSAVRAEEV